MKLKVYLAFIVFIFMPFLLFAADETLTITTYYPSPYGSYNQLSVASNTYLAYSSGSVGIGTTAPGAKLDIAANGGGAGATSPVLRITNTNTGTVTVGAPLGSLEFYSSVSPGLAYPGVGAAIKAIEENVNGYKQSLAFYTASMDTAATEWMRITSDGNVGIGTVSPSLTLDVYNGWIGSSGGSNSPTGGFRFGRWPAEVGNTWVYLSRADSTAYQDLAIGALWAGGSLRFGTADDLAEMTPVNPEDDLESGDAVVIDTRSDRVRLTKSKKPYDTKVAGIISNVSTAGLIIGGSHPSDVKRKDIKPLAISGRVLAKVSAENGSIQAGDFLTTSANPGYLMRCDDRTKCGGAIAGKAMEHFKQKKGKIWVLVALQ